MRNYIYKVLKLNMIQLGVQDAVQSHTNYVDNQDCGVGKKILDFDSVNIKYQVVLKEEYILL